MLFDYLSFWFYMSPFDGFTVNKFFTFTFNSLDISITITTLILVFITFIFFYLFNNNNFFKKYNTFLLIFNHFYQFFLNISHYSFLPYILITFFFILLSNLLGIIPYSFTITSQFVITFFLSFTNIFAITLIGLFINRFSFFKLFLPKGVHISILPLIFFIEIISYLSRIISLSIRLSANMISGHVILTLLSSVGFLILPILLFIYLLEFIVAVIQAYVFAVLLSIYLSDVININSH